MIVGENGVRNFKEWKLDNTEWGSQDLAMKTVETSNYQILMPTESLNIKIQQSNKIIKF